MSKPLIQKILFIYTGNSCRNQMAEGWVRKRVRDEIKQYVSEMPDNL